MSSKTISNPHGAYGYSDLQTKGDQDTRPMVAGGTIAATGPQVVAVASNGVTVTVAATDAAAGLCRGIVREPAVAGRSVLMVTGGPVANVPVDGATTAGAVLKRSVTTAGRLAATASPAAGEAFAISLAASSSNTTSVWVL